MKKVVIVGGGFGGNPKDKSAVRGGPGFELIFNINHYLKQKGLRDKFELTMFAPMEEPGARMGKMAMKVLHKMFAEQHINKRFGKKITEFAEDGVQFEDGSKLQSDLTMFIAAGTGSAVLKNTDLPLSEAGFVKINNFNQVAEFPNVFAIGDAAAYEGPEWTARQGHITEVIGRNAAHNILQIEKGSHALKGYQEHLSILCVMDMGNGAAFVYRDNKREIMIPMPIVGHAALIDSEEKFSVAFRTSPYAITITQAKDGLIIGVNDAFYTITGYTREETLYHTTIGMELWVDEECRNSIVNDPLANRNVLEKHFHFRNKELFSSTTARFYNQNFLNRRRCEKNPMEFVLKK